MSGGADTPDDPIERGPAKDYAELPLGTKIPGTGPYKEFRFVGRTPIADSISVDTHIAREAGASPADSRAEDSSTARETEYTADLGAWLTLTAAFCAGALGGYLLRAIADWRSGS